jgi:NTE family protein
LGGLLSGLVTSGIALAESDLIAGTSAGAVVGANLALGNDLAALASAAGEPLPMVGTGGSGYSAKAREALADAIGGAEPAAARARFLAAVADVPTVDEETYVRAALFAALAGHSWPPAFRCTAIEVGTGAYRVFDASANVSLRRAVASSCSVPGVFPPVTLRGHGYVDGGFRTTLNADLAVGAGAAIVVSCLPLEPPPDLTDPVIRRHRAKLAADIAAVRDSGTDLAMVTPDDEFLALSGWGRHLMDHSRAADAYAAGLHQATNEVSRLAAVWEQERA